MSRDVIARPSTPRGRAVRSRSASSRSSSRFARISLRRIGPSGILRGSGCLSASSTAPRSAHASRALVLAEPSCPTRRLNLSLSIGSAPRASWRSRSYARHQVRPRSHTPPSSKPRDRRAKLRPGSHRRVRIRPVLIAAQPPRAVLDRVAAGSSRGGIDRSRNGSRDALSRSFMPLEARELTAMAPTVTGRAPGDDGRYRRSPISTRASTAGERRRDVVQRPHEANLMLAGDSVHPRPCTGSRAASTSPRDDPGRGVGSQLIPGCAEHLKRFLQRSEGVGRGRMASRLFSGRMEGPRGLDQLRRAVVERICRVHADHRRRGVRSRPWGSMPK